MSGDDRVIQADLFAAQTAVTPAISGLDLWLATIEPALELRLVEAIDNAPLAPFRFHQWEGRRLTASYGSAYDYQHGRVTEAAPFPDWLADLARLVERRANLAEGELVQVLLTRYDPGAGIGWHRDRPQYGAVFGLSLTAPATLRLRRRTETGFERAALPLPPRSLYRLDGAVRTQWEHSIAPGRHVRRSITLRTLRPA